MLHPVRANLQSHGKQEVLFQNCSIVQSRQPTVSHRRPRTAPCVSQPQKDRMNGDWVSGPPGRLNQRASNEQPLALAVSFDANAACIFLQ